MNDSKAGYILLGILIGLLLSAVGIVIWIFWLVIGIIIKGLLVAAALGILLYIYFSMKSLFKKK